MNMKRRTKGKAATLLMLVLLAALVLGGCGATKDMGAYDLSGEYEAPAEGGGTGYIANDMVAGEQPEAMLGAENKQAEGGNTGGLVYNENVKLIFRAYLRLQTTDYEQAEKALTELTESLGGYFESSYIDKGGYYYDEDYLSGSYVVRVPAEKYDEFLTSVGNTCHVVSINKTTEDVGVAYFDTESRLNTLKTKQERLTALLAEAQNMADIIELENALSDVQYQMDSYSSTLNRYDSLIGYSTVEISLEQVARLSSGVDENAGFFSTLGKNLKEGFYDFFVGLGDLILWVAYNLLTIIVAVVILIFAVKLYRRKAAEGGDPLANFKAKREARKAEKAKKKAEKAQKKIQPHDDHLDE